MSKVRHYESTSCCLITYITSARIARIEGFLEIVCVSCLGKNLSTAGIQLTEKNLEHYYWMSIVRGITICVSSPSGQQLLARTTIVF